MLPWYAECAGLSAVPPLLTPVRRLRRWRGLMGPGKGCGMSGCGETISRELLKALGEFNRGEWFECHETLEELWVGSSGEMRDFYQG
ncbi:MAG TPA: DUF309 domain-containing protein, partial [Verrucomicrobiae bacterium]|nr:DUF309 domain-containing protein [Verrucomicrobiae bacterium]